MAASYEDLQIDPMVHFCDTQGLIFRWRGGTNIEVGREAEDAAGKKFRLFDQSIGVYDQATGKRTLAADDRKGFEARCIEWCKDMYGCGKTEDEEDDE